MEASAGRRLDLQISARKRNICQFSPGAGLPSLRGEVDARFWLRRLQIAKSSAQSRPQQPACSLSSRCDDEQTWIGVKSVDASRLPESTAMLRWLLFPIKLR